MDRAIDLGSRFASRLAGLPISRPNAAVNALNDFHAAARTPCERAKIEEVWRDFLALHQKLDLPGWRAR